jgi:uncharacterized protein (DUF1697 family)
MPRFVVLLRGVNVGKGNRVPMAEFRRLLEAQGHAEVRTLLNSGNAVFSASGRSAQRHAKAIAEALHTRLAVTVPVIVKTAGEFDAIVAGNTLVPPAPDPSRLLVVFAPDAAALQDLGPIAPLVRAPERFVIGRHAAYLDCAGGILESPAASALLGKAGRGVTTRNWATVLKLAALLPARAGGTMAGSSS